HCGYPESGVLERTAALTSIGEDILKEAVEHERAGGDLVRDPQAGPAGSEPWLYLKPLFLAELGAARTLRKLCEGPHPLPAIDTEAALIWVEKKMGLELARTQRDAIAQAATCKL